MDKTFEEMKARILKMKHLPEDVSHRLGDDIRDRIDVVNNVAAVAREIDNMKKTL